MRKVDVAVLGAGVAGLSVAAHVARSGKSVLVTETSVRCGGSVAPLARDGYVFTAGPSAVFGLEPGGLLRSFVSSSAFRLSEPLRPARYQVALPDRRITVAPEQQETLAELRREFPREIDRIAVLHREAGRMLRKISSSRIESWIAGRRSALSFLRKYRFSPELLAFYDVQSRYFFGQGLPTLPLEHLVRLVSASPAEYAGGFTQLAEHIAANLPGERATILWNEPWPELQYRGRRAQGIVTSQGTIEARTVLINANWNTAEQVLFLGIQENVIPVRMENTVLCLTEYQRPEDSFSLSVAPRGVNAPANMRALSAVFPVSGDSASTTDVLIDRMLPVMPFLRDFTSLEAVPDTGARRYAFTGPVVPRIYPASDSPRHSPHKTFKNVLILEDTSRNVQWSAMRARQMASRLA